MRIFVAGASGVIGRQLLPLPIATATRSWPLTRSTAKDEA
jgi:hypothetical protein